ncbi:flagellin N-terminal helical domain-containing protein [Pandoraea communis]|uniref:Flagellin n=1 Tax=Pandoraea communis TaxID=2508297 RepID=A0A5E4X4Y0_9BURK|nr:flagellin [Pandoraea communis]MDM8358217.1 flagellin [Pandoraea communis]VVE31411.1 lateral flagellin LafA [Pandoraea communis]
MLTLHTNVAQMSSLNSQRSTGGKLNAIMRDLSTGKKNDLYKNDPAAARISAMLNMHASGTKSAISNMKYAQSSTRVAQGALDKANELLVTMKDLATQAKDGLKGDAEKAALQQQYTNNAQALQAIFENTTFAGKNLLKMGFGGAASTDGVLATGGGISLQVGAGADETKRLDISTDLRGLFANIGTSTANFGALTTSSFNGGSSLTDNLGASTDAEAAAMLVRELKQDAEIATILGKAQIAATPVTWETALTTALEGMAGGTRADYDALKTALTAAVRPLSAGAGNALTLGEESKLFGAFEKMIEARFNAPTTQLLDAGTASSAITNLESAISQLATVQASIGAAMMDLDGREEVQSTLLQNTREANSRLNEVDFAESVSELTKLQTQMNVNLQMLQKAGEMPGMIQMLLR